MNRMYVDSVDLDGLVETAIRGMLEELDPHSVYIPSEDLQQADEPLNGKFEGIGVRFNIMKDTIMVVSTIAGGPSEKLGIMAGDRIVEVDGEVVAGVGIRNKGVMERLKGPKGTHVEVGIRRGKSTDLLVFDIERDKIPIYSVDAHYMVDDRIGLHQSEPLLQRDHVGAFGSAGRLESRRHEGPHPRFARQRRGHAQHRHCHGRRVPVRKPPHCLHRRSRFPREDRVADTPGRFEKGRLVVLVDESSASASEIVSGAVQDWDRGLIVGRRTFERASSSARFACRMAVRSDSPSNNISPQLAVASRSRTTMGSTPIAGRNTSGSSVEN